MSKHFDKLLKTLKTRNDVTALGFSKDELKSLASDIDENLDSIDENATDEDVENAINKAVDGVIPMLKLAQMQASRIVTKKLKEVEDANAQRQAEEEEKRKAAEKAAAEAGTGAATGEGDGDDDGKREPGKKDNGDDELKSLIKTLTEKISKQDEAITKQNETIASLLKGNVMEKRKALLESKLKDSGRYGRNKLREFERITFKDDAEFDAFVNEVDDELEEIRQEEKEREAALRQKIANEALASGGKPPKPEGGSASAGDEEVEPYSDDEIDNLYD